MGVLRRPQRITEDEILEALRLNDDDVPITELTRRSKQSWKTVRKALKVTRAT